MIEEYKKLVLDSPDGDVAVFLNYADTEEVKNCKTVRFEKDGKTLNIKREDLVDIALQILDETKQENIKKSPLITGLDMAYSTVIEHSWLAPRDIRKGEMLIAQGKYDMEIPVTETVLSGNMDRKIQEVIFKPFIDGGITRYQEILNFNCSGVKFTMRKADFKTFVFMISDEVDHKRMIPMEMTKVKKRIIKLNFQFKSSKNYRKGEKITVTAPYVVDIRQNAIFGEGFKLGHVPGKLK